MIISIIIPTSNRDKKIDQLIKSLISLQISEENTCEILIIDNNPNEYDTWCIKSQILTEKISVRYLVEKRKGKSYALNTGVKNAKGDILFFIDDDCIPDKNWLISIIGEFDNDPSVSVIGGRVELYDLSDKPVTICSSKKRSSLSSPSQLYFPPIIIGCNMAVRRKVFDLIKYFDPLLGPGTMSGTVADDIDFLYRVYKKKLKIVYTPAALVYHNHGRKTDTQVNVVLNSYYLGRGAFYCKYFLKADSEIISMALKEIASLIKTIIKGYIINREYKMQRKKIKMIFNGAYNYCKYGILEKLSEKFVNNTL